MNLFFEVENYDIFLDRKIERLQWSFDAYSSRTIEWTNAV